MPRPSERTTARPGLAAFHALLRLYPGEFRDEYGREMAAVLSDRYRDAAGGWERSLISIEAVGGILMHAPKEHIHMIARDLRYAARLLRKSPAFTMTAILSLAIGIGANTAIFAVAKKVLWDALPVSNPQQLRMLTWVSSGPERPVPPVWGDVSSTKEGGLASPAFSYPVLVELRKEREVFQDLVAFKNVDMTATVDGHAELIAVEMLSGGALEALGVPAVIGRTLAPADDAGPGTPPAVVISAEYWTEKFGRSNSALGKTISLNGMPVTIVGVAAAPFSGLTTGTLALVFVPLTLQPLLVPRAQSIGNGGTSLLMNPESWWVQVMARLREGVPEQRTQAALDFVLRRTAMATLPAGKGIDRLHLQLEPGNRGLDDLSGFAKPSYVLLALAGLVLLLACVNVANLLLARAVTRQREMSTRLALGASRTRILRQVLTESLLLSGAGGLAGVSLAYMGRNIIPRLLTDITVDFDWRVVAFTVGVSLATAIVFGAVPMWQAMHTDVQAALKDAGHSTMGRQKLSLGKGLVVVQVALSTILLMGAGLFVRTLVNLSEVPLGFQADHMLLFKLNPPRARYTETSATELYRQIEEKLAAIPGVRSVTLSNIALIGDGHSGSTFHVSGSPPLRQGERVQTDSVGADFFATMGIPILQGRGFSVHDNASSPMVAVVNRALVRKYFPNGDAIGQTFDSEDADGLVQVVGIVADTRYADLRSETPPTFYRPYRQTGAFGRMILEIRTRAEPFSVLNDVRAAIESLDRDLPLINVRTQEQQIQASLSSERMFAQLTSSFGVLALVLASIGIYGLMAYTVARRTSEIGIRMAIGARVEQVLRGVLREALWLAMGGVTVGIGASFWLSRFVGTMLYGLKATDPIIAGGTAVVLVGVTLLASVGPARRASRVDPLQALRHE